MLLFYLIRHEANLEKSDMLVTLKRNTCLLKIRVVTKHTGFIRMALQEGAHLVPILSFGEVDIMDNVRFPFLQQWFLKTAGMVFPHQPYGLYYLPIPRKCSM